MEKLIDKKVMEAAPIIGDNSQEVFCYSTISSPLGDLYLVTNQDSLISLSFSPPNDLKETSLLTDYHPIVEQELAEYFDGTRQKFDLNLSPHGTNFQREIWHLVYNVSYGNTASYKQISENYNDPRAIRAVGTANGKNPIPIIIPCHRVIGSNNKLVGYSGELWRKQWLLEHEAKFAGQQRMFS